MTNRPEPDLESAMTWTAEMLHHLLAGQEMRGALLHLIDKERGVDLVLLSEGMHEALPTARALIVVRAPAVATLAAEVWAAQGDPKDPLLRDWFERRSTGQEAPVTALPLDYRFEMLVMAGETREGAYAERYWRIAGDLPKRTFAPYAPPIMPGLSPSLRPLFLDTYAQGAGVDPQKLRRSAQHYLAHNHAFVELYHADEKDPS